MTWMFIPCFLCFCEEYDSSARTRSVGINVPSTMTKSPSPRPTSASCRPGAQAARTPTPLVHVPPRRRFAHSEPSTHLGERLVLPQVGEDQQSLLEAAQLPPGRAQFTSSGVDEPGDMLDQLIRHVEHGRIRNQQSPRGVGSVEWNQHRQRPGALLCHYL